MLDLGNFGRVKMDKEFSRQQARLVRSLADQADPFIKRRLLQLAEHYEHRLPRSNSKYGDIRWDLSKNDLPTAPSPAPVTKAASEQAQDKQKHNSTDKGIHNGGNDSNAEMNAKPR